MGVDLRQPHGQGVVGEIKGTGGWEIVLDPGMLPTNRVFQALDSLLVWVEEVLLVVPKLLPKACVAVAASSIP